ncbi:MAG: hypothetical protein ACLGIS_14510 [Actinomycetes bacterium]
MTVLSRDNPADPGLRFPQERKATASAYLTREQLLAQYEALAAKGCQLAALRVRNILTKREGQS